MLVEITALLIACFENGALINTFDGKLHKLLKVIELKLDSYEVN